MKFMKLGSKPDTFQADGKFIRYVTSDLATDVTINVGEVKFYLHKVQLKCLADETQAFSKGLEKVVLELSASENDGPVSETFCKTVMEFLGFAEGEVKSLILLQSCVGKNADSLAHYFGEDPARCPFEQVMSTLLSFSKMFVRAHEENCKQLELEMKKAKEAENRKLKK